MNIATNLAEIQNSFDDLRRKISSYEKKHSDLVRVVATVLQKLERSLKNPSLLNQAVYDSIDLCRANFSYMDYSSGQIKQDAPLADSDKILP
jgi:hypothetical protein